MKVSNPFFNALGGSVMGNPMQMLSQLKSNPFALLSRAGFNIPANMSNPQAIIQHLMNSGQISQQQFNSAQQMAQNFRL